MIKPLILSLGVIALSSVSAQADERYSPIQNDTVLKECGACHIAFQPEMLPKRSWVALMSDLGNHFGEDASLNEKSTREIMDYLVENSADSDWWSGKFMRGVRDDWTPLRITDMPYWVREHNEEVRPSAWNDPKVKTKANCKACHREADKGYYDDD